LLTVRRSIAESWLLAALSRSEFHSADMQGELQLLSLVGGVIAHSVRSTVAESVMFNDGFFAWLYQRRSKRLAAAQAACH
jgi:hypothetical protein